MATGVIFSKFYRMGSGYVAEALSRHCFCTPGKRPLEMANMGCVQIPSTFFGERIKIFVEHWDSTIVREGEVALWGSFFVSRQSNKMTIQRLSSSFIYEVEVLGNREQLSTLCKASFPITDFDDETIRQETEALRAKGYTTKDKVLIFAKNRLFPHKIPFPSPNVVCNMQQPFSECIKENRIPFDVFGIDPHAVKAFALAPGIWKMTQQTEVSCPIMQHFSEVL